MQRTTRGLGATVAVLLVLAVLALANGPAAPAATRLAVSTPTTSRSPTTTEPAPAAGATDDPRPIIPFGPATTAMPLPVPTVPDRPFSLTPTSGRAPARATVSGTGCTGRDAGVGIAYLDGTGQIGADSTTATSDGTWTLPVIVPPAAVGPVTIEAFCFDATTNARSFSYAPQTFLVTR